LQKILGGVPTSARKVFFHKKEETGISRKID
jgi:hypothetical protein